MITFLIYILKSSFCILLLYAIYKLLLSSTTHFRFNRCVVIAGTAVSMFLPFVSLEIEKDISAPVSFYMLEEMAMSEYSRDIADIKTIYLIIKHLQILISLLIFLKFYIWQEQWSCCCHCLQAM